MPKLSYAEVKTMVASVVEASKLSNVSFVETRNNIVGLLDKIGKIFFLDTAYQQDKLAMFDGEYLSFGKNIEEWSEDLLLPTSYDSEGAGALSPSDPTYRPVFYSYSLGRKKIKTTIRNDNIERAVHFEGQLAEIVAIQFKRIEDSMAVYRYAMKREMIAKAYEIATSADLGLGSNATWLDAESENWTDSLGLSVEAKSGKYVVNVSPDNLTDKSYAGKYIVVKNIASDSTKKLTELVAEGFLIKLDIVKEIAKPSDTSTGEAFIKQVKADLEVASDLSEGHSLNGNSLGATESLVLVVKQNILPSIEVDTYAGAFHKEDVALPADLVVVKDFGSAPEGVFAMLCDRRAFRLHNTYNATRENVNGDGDFLNVFRHTEDTAYMSRNTFLRFYVAPTE